MRRRGTRRLPPGAGGGGDPRRSAAPTTPLPRDLSSKIPARLSENEAGDALQLPSDLISPPAIPRLTGPAACVGVRACVCGALLALPPSLSPSPEPAHRPGREERSGAGGDGRGRRGPLTVVPHLGVPVKVRPDAVADEEGADLEATLPRHGAAGAKRTCQGALSRPPPPLDGPSPCYHVATDAGSPLCDRSETVIEASMGEPLLGFRVNMPASRGW